MDDLLNIKEASLWASEYLGRTVTTSNISYLINYGKIERFEKNGTTLISRKDLTTYYETYNSHRESIWKEKLGDDLDWSLSFDNLKEAETTKHVHRLHPYKGKFIPQLVEYFLDQHTDSIKTEVYFNSGDLILDPFCGSGTTLVQANELGIHAIGIDISAFNALISNIKITAVDIANLEIEINRITNALNLYIKANNTYSFESELTAKLKEFNDRWFPVPDFKRKVFLKEIDGDTYGTEKAIEFAPIYNKLVQKYNIRLLQPQSDKFIEIWYTDHIRQELTFVYDLIQNVYDSNIKNILYVILSRTMRSCRATTHSDLATLKEPVTAPYYCKKHGKICKPLFSILRWWKSYSKDTINRLTEFSKIKTETFQFCLTGDSRNIDILNALCNTNQQLRDIVQRNKINGIFSSPPYVGLIDYHEQHAYAYDILGFQRNDDLEIGPLFRGNGKAALDSYVDGISNVLINCEKYLIPDYDIFLVANDKYNLYPKIADKANMVIVNSYKRPVLNRTEKDKSAYSETIFHLKRK